MEIAVKTFFVGISPRMINQQQRVDTSISKLSSRRSYFCTQTRCSTRERRSHRYRAASFAVLSGAEDVGVFSSQSEDFLVSTARTSETRELKISVEVSGAKTRAIFDEVFDKMVAAAQPIPGFRRVKGGKTPNIPREILLEILGPSKVYKEVIKTIINSAVAEYVQKVPKSFLLKILGEDRVTKFVMKEIVSSTMTDYTKKENLYVKERKFNTTQKLEELKGSFAPGKDFGFNATLELEKPDADRSEKSEIDVSESSGSDVQSDEDSS